MSASKKVAELVPDYPGRQQLESALRPLLEPAAKKYAGHKVQRLLGFWLCWHTMGGLDGLLSSGIWSRSGVYGQRKEFHEVFGVEVEVWAPHLSLALVDAETAHRHAVSASA